MIDLQLIRKDSKQVAAALAKKGVIVSFDELLEWDKERRALIAEVETLKARRNKVSGEAQQGQRRDPPLQEAGQGYDRDLSGDA